MPKFLAVTSSLPVPALTCSWGGIIQPLYPGVLGLLLSLGHRETGVLLFPLWSWAFSLWRAEQPGYMGCLSGRSGRISRWNFWMKARKGEKKASPSPAPDIPRSWVLPSQGSEPPSAPAQPQHRKASPPPAREHQITWEGSLPGRSPLCYLCSWAQQVTSFAQLQPSPRGVPGMWAAPCAPCAPGSATRPGFPIGMLPRQQQGGAGAALPDAFLVGFFFLSAYL